MTESSKLGLLQATLNVAVPLRIEELRRKPLSEILDPEALRSIQTRLGEAREEVLYGGRCGAAGFNALTDGLARLAFLPGGIVVLGMHFDAGRQLIFAAGQTRSSTPRRGEAGP